MKVKIKLKTLILITVLTLSFIIFVVPIGNLLIANTLKERGSDKAEIFYKSYMKSPIKINHDNGFYNYADDLTKGLVKYHITPSGWGGAEMTSPENIEKAMGLFEEILLNDKKKNYQGDYSIKAYTKLLDTSIAILDAKKLEYWIEWGSGKENKEIQYISSLYKAYYLFAEKNYKEAETILEGLDKEFLDAKYYQLMGEINVHLDDIDGARENYKTLEKIAEDDGINRQETYFGGSYLLLDEYMIKEHVSKLGGDYKVRGKVTQDGKGLPFVEIYLDTEVGSFSTLGNAADAVTDKNGEFETAPLKQDVYSIGIMINPSQLYDKVFVSQLKDSIQLKENIEANFEFGSPIKITSPVENKVLKEEETLNVSWDKVEGADYYKMKTLAFSNPKEKSGAISGITIKDMDGQEKIKTNSIDFGINNIDKKPMIYSYEEDEETINPGAILASFIPNIDSPLIVEAYDKEDRMLSSSITLVNNYEDIVSVKFDKELSTGEKLILDKKYEATIEHYENRLKEDPEDKEALLYLTRLYRIGYKREKRDILKAMEYAKIYDSLYDDYSLSLEVVDEMTNKQKQKNIEDIKTILENIQEKDKDSDYYYAEARYFVASEDFESARLSYEMIRDYKHQDILYIDMYLEDWDRAISMLGNGEFNVRKMNIQKLTENLSEMNLVSKEDKAIFKGFLKMIVERDLDMQEQSRVYYNTFKSVKSPELREILKEIAKEEYLEKEYIIRD